MIKAHAIESAASALGRKRPQVLLAARELFLRQGYASTTMDTIAAKAGVSKATLYAYFPGKSEVFIAIAMNEVELLSAALADIGSKSELPLQDKLEAIGLRVVRTQLKPENVDLFRIVISQATGFPNLGKTMSERCRAPLRAVVAAVMADARGAGLLRAASAEHAAIAFLTMMRGDMLLNALMDPASQPVPEADLRAHIHEQVALFLLAFGI
jgi:TetR/AcrR family transcriptional repressor of mexJK operon